MADVESVSSGAGSSGTLYVVSTPIGNLEDISFRAVKVLSEVDLIAAEDTRKTGILLSHYHLHKPTISFFSYNDSKRTAGILAKLRGGTSVALVTDAGTPGISDPGSRLISEALNANVPVVSVPGPTAFLPALIVSGLPAGRFVFEGFLPAKKGRTKVLEKLRAGDRTVIFYESPHRLLRTLKDLHESLGDREISVARELTKKFEEIVRGRISDAIMYFSSKSVKGEFVLVVSGSRSERH